jgi:transposase
LTTVPVTQALREWLEERGTEPVIPPRKNRKIQYDYDRAVYKQRNVVERMFCRSAASRTGAVSPPVSIATSKTSWAPSASQPLSYGG